MTNASATKESNASAPIASANQAPVDLAIAGLGLVGKRHAEAIANVANANLVAVVDPSEEAKAYCQPRKLAHYPTLEAMFAERRPAGVILSTPTPLHVDQALGCVAEGCPVMVEKPLATSAQAAKPLLEAALANATPLLVGHHRRHNPLIRKAKQIISDGKIGQVRAVQATCWFYKPDPYFDIAPWRKLKGAGPISVNLVHDVDLLRYLCGEIVSVQAQAALSLRGFENEDVAAAVLRFESGAVGTISVSDSIVAPWSWEMTSREYPVYPVTDQSCYHIGGSHGALSIPDLKLWSHSQERDWWTPLSATVMPRDASDPLINQIRHFVEVIAGREQPLVSGQEGYRTLQVVEAIQSAALTGQTIELPCEA